jgi:hypothetical protein
MIVRVLTLRRSARSGSARHGDWCVSSLLVTRFVTWLPSADALRDRFRDDGTSCAQFLPIGVLGGRGRNLVRPRVHARSPCPARAERATSAGTGTGPGRSGAALGSAWLAVHQVPVRP